MKHLSLILAVVILTTITASAQMHQGMGMSNYPGTMGYNHMGYNNMGYMMYGNNYGMMNGQYGNMMYGQMMPMRQYMFMVNMMPQMQDQLGLTTEQSNKLIDLQTAYMKQIVDLQADLSKKQMTLEELLENNAPADQVKVQLESCAQTRTELDIAAYQSGSKMRNVLNDSQKKTLDNLLVQCFNGNCMMGGYQDTDDTN